MRKYLRNLTAIWVAVTLSGGAGAPALAHAAILTATPAVDQHVAPGNLAIRLEFNVRIDKERSRLQLSAPDGAKAGIAIEPDGEPNVVTGKTGELTAGAYVLRWQVLALDGHITRGDIPFTVGD